MGGETQHDDSDVDLLVVMSHEGPAATSSAALSEKMPSKRWPGMPLKPPMDSAQNFTPKYSKEDKTGFFRVFRLKPSPGGTALGIDAVHPGEQEFFLGNGAFAFQFLAQQGDDLHLIAGIALLLDGPHPLKHEAEGGRGIP